MSELAPASSVSPVSIVIPALGDTSLLEKSLRALRLELNLRGGIDEIVLVDDTGSNVLAAWAAEEAPTVRVVARKENGGFARALSTGIEAAKHELVFAMNSDVIVSRNFLAPLVRALESADVFAAVPRVLLGGDERRVESVVEILVEDDLARLDQPCLGERNVRAPRGNCDVPFAIGGACLLRKRDFRALDGFDPIFEPFYLEDVDLCWRAWLSGKRVVLCGESSVEHQNRGTIGKIAPAALVRAAIERNVLLFQWKHFDDRELARHVDALERTALAAWIDEDRERLTWLALAFERADLVLAARAGRSANATPLAELARRTRPLRGEE